MEKRPQDLTPAAVEFEVVFAALASRECADLVNRSAEIAEQTRKIERLADAVRDAEMPSVMTFTAA